MSSLASSACLVGLGGGIGAVGRFLIGRWLLHLYPSAALPVGTLAVNLVGCFLIGVIAGFVGALEPHRMRLELFLITGILGGFTTFSAFGFELMGIIKRGEYWVALSYVALSVIGGLVLCIAGYQLSR